MDLANVKRQPRLAKSPLTVALCQLRFPKQIGVGPSEVRPIQRALSEKYPVAKSGTTQDVVLIPGSIMQGNGEPDRVWLFGSEDGKWTVTVGTDALTLETSAYTDVVDFLARWQEVSREVVDAFELTRQERIGLRYVNELVAPSSLTREQLLEIVRPELAGSVGAHPRTERVLSSFNETRFAQARGTCTLRHGLIRRSPSESFYVLDMDFYEELPQALDLDDQVQLVSEFAEGAYELFSWAIAPDRFASFEPTAATQ